ncbi:MAG: hypothetical protein QOD53_889 [Thermoleophilaceae bacterium]|nr:hypothetical protein [Thermoleophilaceae bacterium]
MELVVTLRALASMASATNTFVIRALFIALLAAACLALPPAAALAQDAGSQQYSDPLAGGGSSKKTGTQSQASTSPAPTSTASSGSQSTQSSTSTAATSSRSDGLPRTGLDVVWLALTGVLLLGGGVAMRRAAERADA